MKNFAVRTDHRVKIKENKKRDKYLELARELKKTWEQEGDGDSNYIWYSWDNSLRLGKRAGRGEYWRTRRDNPNYSMVKIGRNTEKSPGYII